MRLITPLALALEQSAPVTPLALAGAPPRSITTSSFLASARSSSSLGSRRACQSKKWQQLPGRRNFHSCCLHHPLYACAHVTATPQPIFHPYRPAGHPQQAPERRDNSAEVGALAWVLRPAALHEGHILVNPLCLGAIPGELGAGRHLGAVALVHVQGQLYEADGGGSCVLIGWVGVHGGREVCSRDAARHSPARHANHELSGGGGHCFGSASNI